MEAKYRKYIFGLFIFIFLAGLALVLANLSGGRFAVFEPKGMIALQERNLIIIITGLVSVVVIPVIILIFAFAWRYREGNSKTMYEPERQGKLSTQLVWWGFPIAMVLVLSVLNWNSTHQLDPYKSIDTDVKPITIQVVALDWKWLFIYPEQNIATVNFVQFPERTPVRFELTADAPMNSFWIPQLGGQMYAMAGMETQLNLIADGPGEFAGSAAEINGRGFAGMKFIAKSSSVSDFEQWVEWVRQTGSTLSWDKYGLLAEPSENVRPAYFSSADKDLYNRVIHKYMSPK